MPYIRKEKKNPGKMSEPINREITACKRFLQPLQTAGTDLVDTFPDRCVIMQRKGTETTMVASGGTGRSPAARRQESSPRGGFQTL